MSCGKRCETRLEDPSSNELFAACFMVLGHQESFVETVFDSSWHFVLMIEDGQDFIGLGFNERSEAFNFNVALSNHEKFRVLRLGGMEGDESSIDIHPAVKSSNHQLKISVHGY